MAVSLGKKSKDLDLFYTMMVFPFQNNPKDLDPSYTMEVFPFQNNPKDLDLSYKTDLDLLDCSGSVLQDGSSSLGLFWKGNLCLIIQEIQYNTCIKGYLPMQCLLCKGV